MCLTGLSIPLLAFNQMERNLRVKSKDNSNLLIGLLILITLFVIIYCYEKRNGYKWTNIIRHRIGDILYRIRTYRKKKVDKQQRIQTDEVLQTPKTVHITEVDNDRPFIQSQPNSIMQPVKSKREEFFPEEQEKKLEVDFKKAFQAKESKSKNKKPFKTKSKLKNKLQNQTFEQDSQRNQIEDQNSFNEENSINNNQFEVETTRGTEVQ